MSDVEGVPVWRDSPGRFISNGSPMIRQACEEGRWFPLDEAQALLDVAASMRDFTGRLNMWECLERLDAARASTAPTETTTSDWRATDG